MKKQIFNLAWRDGTTKKVSGYKIQVKDFYFIFDKEDTIDWRISEFYTGFLLTSNHFKTIKHAKQVIEDIIKYHKNTMIKIIDKSKHINKGE